MELLKEQVAILQKDAQNILTRLDALYETNSKSKVVVERAIDDYLWEVESLCVKSRIRLDGFRSSKNESDLFREENNPIEVAGSIEVTFEGWLHIRFAQYLGLRSDCGLNKHIMIYGATGSGKSRGFVKPLILKMVQLMLSGKDKQSMIIVDPKAELFEQYSEYLRENGYVVRALNLLDTRENDLL